MPEDTELLLAWRAGDAACGEQLYRRHFDGIARFFRNKVAEGADDLIQATFVACLKARESFRGDSSFRTYLFTVARHELYRHLRERQHDRQSLDPLATSVRALGVSMTSFVAGRREERLLLEGLRGLPVEHQLALELFYWEDMSASEIGRVLEIPEGTVRTRLRRARQLLEQEIERLGRGDEALASTRAGLEDWARGLRDSPQS